MTTPCPTPGKTGRYPTKAEAVTAAARIRIDARGGHLTPYRCVCGLWHLQSGRSLTHRIRRSLSGKP